MRFQDKVAIITAGAAGIGRATGAIMASEGAIVAVVDRDAAGVDAAVGAIRAAGGKAIGVACDALDESQAAAAVQRVVAECGRIDILVNGVGGSTIIANAAAATDELSFADWRKLVAFNMDATFLFCHEAIPVMKAAGGGKIVSISSIAGRGLSPISSVAYAAGKGGIIAFTKKLSLELAGHGINVNAIAPSFTVTERMQGNWDARGEQARQAAHKAVPLGRIATALDQARVICFLASGDADFITGQTIDVTGGLS